jgi:hypothetical protein
MTLRPHCGVRPKVRRPRPGRRDPEQGVVVRTMKTAILVLLGLGLALVGIADTAAAHIEVGQDHNGDGDCTDEGEFITEVPGPVHQQVCLPSP